MNCVRPFQQSNLRKGVSTGYQILRFADLSILERNEETIQLVFKGGHNLDTFHTSDDSMQAVFAQKVEPSDCRRMHDAILTSRLDTTGI